MLDIIKSKKAGSGMYIPESVWMAYKGLDFVQKKEPSVILTYFINNILD